MRVRFDQTGFPIAHCPGRNLGVQLLPTTRVQFEYYLGAATGFSEETYRELERLAPRASWRCLPDVPVERVLRTGLRPDEVERFAGWLGDGFRLPTEDEWRAADAALGGPGSAVDQLRPLLDRARLHPAARGMLAWAGGRPGPVPWRVATLLDGGVLEWVRVAAGGYGLHGRPAPSLVRLLHNPQVHPAVQPLTPARHPGYGFRLVCPWTRAHAVS